LHGAAGHHGVASAGQGISQQVFELPTLVAAPGKPGEVISLDP